jgi:hypothetical protein
MKIHVCSFSGGVARLKPKQQHDSMAVLKALFQDGNVSTWDMGEHNLWKTIQGLQSFGYVKELKVAYPWCKFEITPLGIEKLKEPQP